MNLPDDFRELLVSLVDAGAEFVVVGGYAVAHHGHVRATKDINVLVRPTGANAARVLRALGAFGAPPAALGIDEADFDREGRVVQLGVAPLRIDLITSATGIGFDEAVASASTLEVDGRAVPVIGLGAVLKNKAAAGRLQDLADVAALERLHGG